MPWLQFAEVRHCEGRGLSIRLNSSATFKNFIMPSNSNKTSSLRLGATCCFDFQIGTTGHKLPGFSVKFPASRPRSARNRNGLGDSVRQHDLSLFCVSNCKGHAGEIQHIRLASCLNRGFQATFLKLAQHFLSHSRNFSIR